LVHFFWNVCRSITVASPRLRSPSTHPHKSPPPSSNHTTPH
jgi:hypothetical protein